MELTPEEEEILAGNHGEMLRKLMKLLVDLGNSYSADKLINIVSAHTVLNFGLNFCNAASRVLHEIAEAGLTVSVPTTADPIVVDFAEDLKQILGMFPLQDQMVQDLGRIGVRGFTCTPYFLDNRPNFGDHCAWSESSSVIYLNSVIGARSNREGGILDLASAITGKTPNYGLHLTENRKGQVLFRVHVDGWNEYDLSSIGLRIGEIAGTRIPVVEGIDGLTFDNLKNLGAASASTGAVALIHVVGLTPEAGTRDEAFQGDSPEEIIDIGQADLREVRDRYSTSWPDPAKNITIGCPHLSEAEVIEVLQKLEGKRVAPGKNLWICCCQGVKEAISGSPYNDLLVASGAKLATLCPMITPLPRPLTTNSGKSSFYFNCTYRSMDECIRIATEGDS